MADTSDNCQLVVNADQTDTDSDGTGDACDPDDDGDAVVDGSDNCPLTANTIQTDTDSDGQGDACDADDDNDGDLDGADNCPLTANADQADNDSDGTGDVCDSDDDNDTVADGSDNCPLVANAGQADSNTDGSGDACTPDYPNADPNCTAPGVCQLGDCDAGYANCDGVEGNGCEVNLNTSTIHCGFCSNVCTQNYDHAATICLAGTCGMGSCDSGWGNCDGSTATGCEQDTDATVAHCGACGNACSLDNATPRCTSGSCEVQQCDTGFGNCDTNHPNGCEADLNTDTSHCNSCNNACTQSFSNAATVCSSGICGMGSCSSGFGDCNSNTSDGCEINLNTSMTHCGSCGSGCALDNASETCSSGSCVITSCDSGYGNCDAANANGCEVHLQTDTSNCGLCSNVCSVTYTQAATVCSSGSCGMGACNSGYDDCNSNSADGCEKNLNTDESHCGSCGNGCALDNATEVCTSGTCEVQSCASGYANCDGAHPNGCEVNTNTSTSHCGSCNSACTQTFTNAATACNSGTCGMGACSSGFGDCNSNSTDGCEKNLNTDESNCGTCGNTCSQVGGTQECQSGSCVILSCDSGKANCDSNVATGCETDLNTDVDHCGACNDNCTQSFSNAATVCSSGTCGMGACDAGWGNCDASSANGCEINTDSSTSHCGSCGNVCNLANATATCGAGECAIQNCASGYADCDGVVANGCEVHLNTDVNNCNTCGNACTQSFANAATVCSGGSCGMGTCNSGYGNCDSNHANGCEMNINGNIFNCGSCGNVCNLTNTNGHLCLSGACLIFTCDSGYANCDSFHGNGCERNLNTDESNCGSCGNVCSLANASEICLSGTCNILSCSSGYADCDSSDPNGCEKNTNSDTSNCGGCGTVCNLSNTNAHTCVSGGCRVSTCDSGYGHCDGNHANGCEKNLNTDESNCGSCGNSCTSGWTCESGTCTAPAPSANLRAQYKTITTSSSTQNIRAHLKIYNDGGSTLALTDIKIRYYFTSEPGGSDIFQLDWAAVGNVQGVFGGSGSNRYLEVRFYSSSAIPTWVCGTGQANQIQAGCNTGEIQANIRDSSWGWFTQTNDHSFSSSRTSYANWTKVTVYYQGTKVWGTTP